MVDFSHSYAVLGLKTGASPEEVKHAYRRLVNEWHPDRFPDDPQRQLQAQERTEEIIAAYSRIKAVTSSSGGNGSTAEPHVVPAGRPPGGGWDKFYSIGINEIDKQHELFIKMLNDIYNTYASSSAIIKDHDAKMELYIDILKLRKYALNHFSSEEKYMIKYRYPHFFEHKTKHDDFIRKIFDLEEELLKSDNLSAGKIIEFMGSWIEEHIKRVDRDFGRYLNNVVGLSFV